MFEALILLAAFVAGAIASAAGCGFAAAVTAREQPVLPAHHHTAGWFHQAGACTPLGWHSDVLDGSGCCTRISRPKCPALPRNSGNL